MSSVPASTPQQPGLVGDDLLTQIIPIEELNKLGFINIDPKLAQMTDPDFGNSVQDKRTAAWTRKDKRWPGSRRSRFIHPIFEEKRWTSISHHEYRLLRPSIQLASRILDEPWVLPFFQGMLNKPLDNINDKKLMEREGKPLQWFDTPPIDPDQLEGDKKQIHAWKALVSLRRQIRWRFGELPAEVYASTFRTKTTSTSEVTLHKDYLRALAKKISPLDVSKNWRPGPEPESAYLRLRFLLAVTMCHEACHALFNATTPAYDPKDPSVTSSDKNPLEPYWRHHRLNELGNEFENQVFTGIMEASGTPLSVMAPYGLKISKWPGIMRSTKMTGYVERGSPEKWGAMWASYYPVPMEHLHAFFTNRFWDQDVLRYGLKSFRPKRTIGVRMWFKGGLNPGESPTAISPDQPSPAHSDRSYMDDERPDKIVQIGYANEQEAARAEERRIAEEKEDMEKATTGMTQVGLHPR
ncbi:hypothetical protein MBLNU459_g7989t1 [Dothideomycetes sp. NU459]